MLNYQFDNFCGFVDVMVIAVGMLLLFARISFVKFRFQIEGQVPLLADVGRAFVVGGVQVHQGGGSGEGRLRWGRGRRRNTFFRLENLRFSFARVICF
jgi:hypothetical protein